MPCVTYIVEGKETDGNPSLRYITRFERGPAHMAFPRIGRRSSTEIGPQNDPRHCNLTSGNLLEVEVMRPSSARCPRNALISVCRRRNRGCPVELIDAKIAELTAMRATVGHLIESCAGDHRPDCQILEDLAVVSNKEPS